MKALLAALTALILLLSITACARKEDIPAESGDTSGTSAASYEFTAKVLDNQQTALLVSVDAGSEVYRSGDRALVTFIETDLTSFAEGDHVCIVYDGSIRESYPLQITGLRIEKITD